MEEMHEIKGSCHCGNLTYVYRSPIPPAELPVRACDCTFCTKQGACYTSHPEGKLAVRVRDKAKIGTYSFGTRSAVSHLCLQCGTFAFMTSAIEGRVYAVINANTLDAVRFDNKNVPILSLSDEPREKRLERRKKYWIGDFTLEERG